METQTVCGSCGAFLGSDAKFCRACGQAVVCASCGAQIGAGAKFCKACGQALGQGVIGVRAATPQVAVSAPAQNAPPRRKRPLGRRALGVAGTAVVATLGIGLAAMIVLRGGGEKAADDGKPGNVQESSIIVLDEAPGEGATRPHLRLEHPAGAVADVPGGPVVFGAGVDLKRIQVADASPAWDRGGIAWRFESVAGITIKDAVKVDLPAAGAAGETVVAQSQFGAWIEIPSEAVSCRTVSPAAAWKSGTSRRRGWSRSPRRRRGSPALPPRTRPSASKRSTGPIAPPGSGKSTPGSPRLKRCSPTTPRGTPRSWSSPAHHPTSQSISKTPSGSSAAPESRWSVLARCSRAARSRRRSQAPG
ncbi:MAG: zinc ribbon domain-containing protein [Dehalococcoidia bacterium]|nr:zinc ribbon domain-containing protein [Dehalococcoidia bacterium]